MYRPRDWLPAHRAYTTLVPLALRLYLLSVRPKTGGPGQVPCQPVFLISSGGARVGSFW